MLLFNEYRVSVLQNRKSSEDWLHNNVNVLKATENVHFKIVKMINFMVYTFYHNFFNLLFFNIKSVFREHLRYQETATAPSSWGKQKEEVEIIKT